MRFAWLIVILAGCAGPIAFDRTPANTDCLVLAPDRAKYADAWRREVARRFPAGAHVLIAHGDDSGGRWVIFNDGVVAGEAEDIAHRLKWIDDTRPWVLVTCNPASAKLNVPGVWYARGMVYSPPGALPSLWEWGGPWTSSINDFVEGSE